MKYTVTLGSMEKNNNRWDIDDMRAKLEWEFSTLSEAMDCFTSLNVKDQFITEWKTATVKPRKRGFYAELMAVEDDDCESLEWAQYTADDYMKED